MTDSGPKSPKSPRRRLPLDFEVPLQSNMSSEKVPSLPSSPAAAKGSPAKWGLSEDAFATNESGDAEDDEVESDNDDDNETAAELSFRFSSVDGGVLVIGEQQAVDVFDLLIQSAFTRVNPQTMYDTFVQHTGDGLLEEETFLEAIEELLSMTDKPHLMENNTFLESMLAIFRSFLPEKCPTVDAFEIAAGFSLMAWGSKSDKLFDAVLQRYGSLVELVDKGEEEILEAIMEGLPSDDEEEENEEETDDVVSEQEDAAEGEGDGEYVDEIDGDRAQANSDMRLGLYTFEDFGLWYNGGGFKGMSWLELLDLRKWVFVSPAFNLEDLDTRPVDPVVASNNYYTANNIQVDVDGTDPPDGPTDVKKPYFTFADVIDEEDEEDENHDSLLGSRAKQRASPSSTSIASSSTAQSYSSSVPASLPAICLKNEIVLEFDLPFDTDDDAITELPLTTLSFDNGDLIQFFELQRVVKLNNVQLYRVYDHGYTIIAWIELLDTKKWPEVSRSVSEAILRYVSRQQQALENATQMGSEDTASGSSNDTVSSNESTNRIQDSVQANFPESDMTMLNTSAFRTASRNALEAGMDAVSGISNLITSPTASATAAKDLSSVALQFKLTSYDNTTLRIRLKDVAIVYTISERMNFSRMTNGELVHLLKKHAHRRALTKPGYLRAMRDLVPRDELSNEDQEFLSFHLLRIFTLFESESVLQEGEVDDDSSGDDGEDQNGRLSNGVGMNTISVEMLQLAAGMSVFCGTTKSAKLSVLFKLFASHGDAHVSRRRLFEMLKSILVVLFAFSSYNATRGHSNDTDSVSSWSTNSIAERAAGAVVSKLFCEATCKHTDAISLAEFATWYAAGGYMDCPWLELLDLSKWPAKEAFEASKREKPLIYAFDMLEEGSILHFTESDISTYLYMLRSTKLGDLSVSKVYDALLAYATPSAEEALKMSKAVTQSRRGQMYSYAAVEEDEGAYLILTRANFYECIRSLVSKEGMSEKAQQTSSKLLSRLFNVFDRKRCGRVNALELACGMSILGKGSKSQKLSLAFDFITKMRQQRDKTLASYAPAPPSTTLGLTGGFGGTGTGNFGLGLGVQCTQFTMSGGGFRFPSTRGLGSTAPGLRSGMNRQAPPSSTVELSALPHSVLFIYLRSFLLALMALSDGTYRLGLEKIYVEADDFIEEAMGDLMTDVTANGGTNAAATTGLSGYGSARSRARVTFEQFGEWYNTGGYQLISWVELLDVSKWQQQQDFQEQSIAMSGPASVYHSKRTIPVMGSQNHGPMSTAAPLPVEPVQPIHHSVKPTTRRRQVRQSDIVSTPFVRGLSGVDGQDQRPEPRESAGAISLSSDGPIMVFAVAKDAAELEFFNEDISTLKLFLRQTQLHTVTSWELQDAVLEALNFPTASGNGVALTRRGKFVRALQQVCGSLPLISHAGGGEKSGFLSEEGMEMMHSLLGVFAHEPTSDNEQEDIHTDGDEDGESEDPIDVGAAVCGMLVVCEGSMFEKLKCCVSILSIEDGEDGTKDEGDGEEGIDGPMVQLETLKSSLMCFLMAFYGMSSSLSAEVARFSAELGADAVLQSFENADSSIQDEGDKKELDLQRKVSLREFNDWFSDAGYPYHPWLELAELNHWPAAINVCGSNGITSEHGD
ncbi:hypothetical protein BBP00_00002635 [Phytophthora kernoviae]|uniref:EF-hand domain-containing protein n=1 Tax=Phytophthora kernoviae TaxID=325452 RepID=A0A3F2RWV2_9STRA|nr:hypothetical protein BBP00_00002635 [Phytophthora kernoviae]